MGQQCSIFAGTTCFLWGKISMLRKLKKMSQFKHNIVERELIVLSVRNQFICGVGYIRSCKAIKTSKTKYNYSAKILHGYRK